MQQENKAIIDTTLELVKIDSRNRPHGEDEISSYISDFLEKIRVDNAIISHEKDRKSLIAYYPGTESGRNLLMCGHLDTINIDSVEGPDNSIMADVRGGKMFGLGTSDMKGGVAAMLYALKELVRTNFKPRYDIFFAFTGDEEADKAGALHLLENELTNNTRLMIVGEPTNLNLGLGSKGQIWFEVKFKGKAAHGSTPDKGKSAVLMAMNFISQILEPEFFVKNEKFFPKSTVNVGFLNADGPFNVVPDTCVAGLDIRLSPPETVENVKKKIKDILSSSFRKNEYELKIVDSLDASFVQPESRMAKEIKKIIGRHASGKRKIALSYATDGSVLNTYASVPVIILGPGIPEVIHNRDEYIPLENIINASRIYTDIMLDIGKII
ncbi:MAG TPA: M20 family metallopeptidase [Actinobacteria bacterium]|nr:M20 family metallopeptidase [Actinomycetota bacterium]